MGQDVAAMVLEYLVVNHCAIMWLWFRRDVPPSFVPWYGFGRVLQIFKNSVVGQK
jgi:hypothetical protein